MTGRQLKGALAVAAIFAGSPAAAQTYLSREHEACYKALGGKGGVALTQGMSTCEKTEFRRQDARLEQLWQRLMKDPTQVGGAHRVPDAAASRRELAAVQRRWIHFRDGQCSWYGRQFARGPDSERASIACLARLTKIRADWVKRLLP